MRCSGAEFYEAAYSTSLGASQRNVNLLIDSEASQPFADLQSLIVITATQILSVELLYERDMDLEVISLPRNGYFAQPDDLVRVHNLVYSSHHNPNSALLFLPGPVSFGA